MHTGGSYGRLLRVASGGSRGVDAQEGLLLVNHSTKRGVPAFQWMDNGDNRRHGPGARCSANGWQVFHEWHLRVRCRLIWAVLHIKYVAVHCSGDS